MIEIKGAIRVNKVRAIAGNIQYAVLLLDDRLVFARTGGQFADYGLGKDIAESLQRFTAMSVDGIVAADKGNFQIPYAEIARAKIGGYSFGLNGPRIGSLSLVLVTGKKQTFDIAPRQDIEACRDILRAVLADRLEGGSRSQTSAAAAGARAGNTPPVLSVRTAESAAAAGPNERLSASVKGGASWFFWISGLSAINAIVYALGGTWGFLVGLGVTQVTQVVAMQGGAEVSAIGLALTAAAIAAFVAFGVWSRKGRVGLFAAGTVIYGLDALLVLWFQDWVGAAFHVLALYFLTRGIRAAVSLRRLERAGSTGHPAAV